MQSNGIAPGVYLGLDIEDYHADPAISSSGIKKLLRSPELYWLQSSLNPEREAEEETQALKIGKAYHTLVFEPHLFGDQFTIKPSVKTSSQPGVLGQGQYDELIAMRDRLMRYQHIPLAITNGLAEVSVFWRDEESGLMCRCRFDYWKPGFVVDLKTCSELDKGGLRDVWYDFPRYGYDISGAMYMEGSRQLKRMLREGSCHVDGGIPADFLERYQAGEKERFMFLYQEKSQPYEAQGRCIDASLAEIGFHKFRMGLERFSEYAGHYGDQPWCSLHPEIVDITTDNVSSTIQYA